MQKRVASIRCCCVDEPIGPVAMDGVILRRVLHLINEHVKWQSDEEISSGWLQPVTVHLGHLIRRISGSLSSRAWLHVEYWSKQCSFHFFLCVKPFFARNQSQLIGLHGLGTARHNCSNKCRCKVNLKFVRIFKSGFRRTLSIYRVIDVCCHMVMFVPFRVRPIAQNLIKPCLMYSTQL